MKSRKEVGEAILQLASNYKRHQLLQIKEVVRFWQSGYSYVAWKYHQCFCYLFFFVASISFSFSFMGAWVKAAS
jgi:hypothetical protein